MLLFTCICGLPACSKGGPDTAAFKTVTFSSCGAEMTRGAMPGYDDRKVKTLDVLAFRDDNGALDSHGRETGNSVTMSVSGGIPLTYYAVTNAPEGSFDVVRSIDDLTSRLCNLSSNTDVCSMIGCGHGSFTTESEIEIKVSRLLSKVTLEGITPEFFGKMSVGSTVFLKSVFLINVNGSCPYSCVPTVSDVWYNRMGYDSSIASPLKDILYHEAGKGITSGEKLTDTYEFICCPNPITGGDDSSTNPDWTPRDTRLVVEILIDGASNFYPVTLPAMECNRNYVIRNLILLGGGSPHPDIPVRRGTIEFSVEVNPYVADGHFVIDY